MRRSPLQSKAARLYVKPDRRYPAVPVDPPKPRAVMAAANDAVVAVPKDGALRSEAYRRYVAGFPCSACSVETFSQAAHPNNRKGLGIKTCDSRVFPLCGPHWGLPGCHWQHDLCIDMDLQQRRDLEAQYEARMQRQAVADGWRLKTLTRKA